MHFDRLRYAIDDASAAPPDFARHDFAANAACFYILHRQNACTDTHASARTLRSPALDFSGQARSSKFHFTRHASAISLLWFHAGWYCHEFWRARATAFLFYSFLLASRYGATLTFSHWLFHGGATNIIYLSCIVALASLNDSHLLHGFYSYRFIPSLHIIT